MTDALKRFAGRLHENPLVRWLLTARRLPMYYAVIVVTSIFYHYIPGWTPFWVIASLLIQSALFRLFDLVKKRPLLGGILYVLAGAGFLALSLWFIRAGYNDPVFSPEDGSRRVQFYIWFFTPQSVFTTGTTTAEAVYFLGYSLGLFLLFSFFIGSIAYYFSFVRYRVLMSFMVMIFPYAIYAKENETMPVPFIILLFAGYFAVMIYCKQARTEDREITEPLKDGGESTLTAPGRKSPFYGQRPELLDPAFFRAGGIFLAGACIAVLVIPKPEVEADRRFFDSLLEVSMQNFADYMLSAISGFSESSDGGTYTQLPYARTLFYTKAEEPLNLRVRSFTNYDYDEDAWHATDYDGQTEQRDDYRMREKDGYFTVSPDPRPDDLLLLIQRTAASNPEFAEKWHLEQYSAADADFSEYAMEMEIYSVTQNPLVYPAPLQITSSSVMTAAGGSWALELFRNETGIMHRHYASGGRARFSYISPAIAGDSTVRLLTAQLTAQDYASLLLDLQALTANDPADVALAQDAVDSFLSAQHYAASVRSQTPDSVRALAFQITDGLYSDYEKAAAIRDYLKYGTFTYSLQFVKSDTDNVETFLFKNRTGVCYQFASAMTELCRAVGLYAREIEGYSMSQEITSLTSEWDYNITTEHGHAFVDVFIPGLGWQMFDPTGGSVTESRAESKSNVLVTLQYSGLILFGAALLALVMTFWLVPMIREELFRRRCRRQRNAAAVQAEFARLRRQWHADPAKTVRVLCAEMSEYLGMDLTDMADGVEETVYADRCAPETADRVYARYCAAYDAWKQAVRRAKRERRRAARAAKRLPAAEG